MRQASSSSSPALNFASTSAAASGAARISEKNSATKEKARYFKVRLLGEVFEIALDLLFHLLHGGLHLLLRLRQAIEGAAFRRHGAGGIELSQPVLGRAHRIAGFADILDDLRIEGWKELEKRFKLFV